MEHSPTYPPDGCTSPETCEALAIDTAGRAYYDAHADDMAPTSGALAVVVALLGLYAVMSIFRDGSRHTTKRKRVTP